MFKDMSNEAKRELLVEMLKNHRFVAVTFSKVSGEVTTRIATIQARPEEDAPKNAGRKLSENNFRYYEWGTENDFGALGMWKSFKLDNLVSVEPAIVKE